ncbi:carboxymuconolactone decarboxylase family protein [Marinicella meishanensis]|uniref:carboxymuconolactone decarboxylase family protein n=1 Tax=Marinicella meishanensis TaxID=2873263 RepID=UPI001CBFDA10|nr:carboxymuconolactone decarboxylase family protein [Marinicella sp. NBU2979]
MSHIPLFDPAKAVGQHHQDFKNIQLAFGQVPNMFKAIGQSPAALNSLWTSFVALGQGQLDTQLTEQIAVLVANLNRCEYCLAAHTLLGQNAGLTATQMEQAQQGLSTDARTAAALQFVQQMVTQKAHLSEADVAQVKQAGFTDAEVAELVAHVALNVFTNYTNVGLAVPTDFPVVPFKSAA